jgi:hypothetical protein
MWNLLMFKGLSEDRRAQPRVGLQLARQDVVNAATPPRNQTARWNQARAQYISMSAFLVGHELTELMHLTLLLESIDEFVDPCGAGIFGRGAMRPAEARRSTQCLLQRLSAEPRQCIFELYV